MLKINIKTIPHEKQRYETVGDYFTDKKGVEQMRISDMKNKDYEFMVALHEFIEQHLTKREGISGKVIDKFDMEYEQQRGRGFLGDDSEAGDDPNCPYRKQHQFATIIEKLLCHEMGIDWDTYDMVVSNL